MLGIEFSGGTGGGEGVGSVGNLAWICSRNFFSFRLLLEPETNCRIDLICCLYLLLMQVRTKGEQVVRKLMVARRRRMGTELTAAMGVPSMSLL